MGPSAFFSQHMIFFEKRTFRSVRTPCEELHARVVDEVRNSFSGFMRIRSLEWSLGPHDKIKNLRNGVKASVLST